MTTSFASYGPGSTAPFIVAHMLLATFAGTQSLDGNTRTASGNGALTVDGVTAAAGMVIAYLPTPASANGGLYVVTDTGSTDTPAVIHRLAGFEVGRTFTAVRVQILRGSVCAGWQGSIVSSATTGATVTIGTTSVAYLSGVADYGIASYTDTSGTPGSATAHTGSGRSAIAATATAATITCDRCTATSVVVAQLEDFDGTLTRVKVVPGAGSFVVTGDWPATATCKFRWHICGAL